MMKFLSSSAGPALSALQRQTTKVLAFALWLHVPIVLALGLFIESEALVPSVVLSAALAAIATGAVIASPSTSATRCLVASSYVLQAATLVFLSSDHPWQIDMHMYFFATLAICVATFDAKAVLAAAGVTALHHLGLNFIAPAWVFPGGADLARVLLHATIVIIQTTALLTLIYKLHEAISTADQKSKELQEAQTVLEKENLERQDMVQQLTVALSTADEKSAELLEAQKIVEQESQQREEMVKQLTVALTTADEKSKELQEAQKIVEQESLQREEMVQQLTEALSTADEKSMELLKAQEIVEQESHQREEMVQQLTVALTSADEKSAELIKAQEAADEENRQREEMVLRLTDALSALASGNLTMRLNTQFSGGYDKLRTDFNTSLEALEHMIAEVIGQIGNIDLNAEEISQASNTLSRRTESQAASLEETAAALDEITATVENTAKGSKEANQLVTETHDRALKSSEVVQNAVRAMGEIETSSSEIAKFVSLIDDIAFQTNLLALNASVEAARAGDAGKGFAVVATEVRSLAQRSSDAAQEIKTIISNSLRHVENGVALVGKTGTELDGIVKQVTAFSELVANITTATDEQATALLEVNSAINQMNHLTQDNAAMAEETTAACASLSTAAGQLSHVVKRFEIDQTNLEGPAAEDMELKKIA